MVFSRRSTYLGNQQYNPWLEIGQDFIQRKNSLGKVYYENSTTGETYYPDLLNTEHRGKGHWDYKVNGKKWRVYDDDCIEEDKR
ncbi:hypothetical protein H6G41_25865 [Tolypothrix sp. FACHB-123]|uniref:hypothetical protein n=1 Tax=Tolypothrix sp. FACHB-123 TaxID=2692868 RepID=UPI001685E5E5|nr:hypothetical protein [Tolypothrix sp. FACHB-123]MBD2357996.1 hypothetical protein [Tolypothrix sp. FACHB-123]